MNKTNLVPAHDEEELQECENWQREIPHVFFKALSSHQTTKEVRVDSDHHNLQQTAPHATQMREITNTWNTLFYFLKRFLCANRLAHFFTLLRLRIFGGSAYSDTITLHRYTHRIIRFNYSPYSGINVKKPSYRRFCVENCKFSLPWQQGSL